MSASGAARRLCVLAIVAGTGCTTMSVPVENENYGARPRRRAPESDRAIDHVVRVDKDPCAGSAATVTAGHRRSGAASGVCVVRAGTLGQAIRVRAGHAYQPSLFGERLIAIADDDDHFYWEQGLFGARDAGQYLCGKLIRRGLARDRVVAVVEPDAVRGTGLLGRTFSRSVGCSDAEAALGALAVMLVEEEAEAGQRK